MSYNVGGPIASVRDHRRVVSTIGGSGWNNEISGETLSIIRRQGPSGRYHETRTAVGRRQGTGEERTREAYLHNIFTASARFSNEVVLSSEQLRIGFYLEPPW